MLKPPILNWENLWGFMVKVAVLEKLLGMRQVLKFNEPMDMNPQCKNHCLKVRLLMVTDFLNILFVI